MWKLTQNLKALMMLMIVMIGIVSRLMIGYGGYTNPIHRFHGPTLSSTNETSIALTEAEFHHFKHTRGIAMETLTHFTWYLDIPTPPLVRLVVSFFSGRDDSMYARAISPCLRPPSLA